VSDWKDDAPIYRQVQERVLAMILDGELKPGDALPSVRQLAVDYRINPLTVSRAYSELDEATLVEKRRGLGLYVREGAREQLLAQERERFLQEEWPALKRRIERLGLSVRDLMTAEDNRERHH
jgi:GntR family transcriptional regulator